MSLAGCLTMTFCWLCVTGFSAFLVIKTLRKPETDPDSQ